jgi:hypothetical protein
VRGFYGAYLYRHQSGAAYELVVPGLFIKASKFFEQQTQLKWELGTGMVQFLSWEPNGGLGLTLSGSTANPKNPKAGVDDWRCIFYPSTGKFVVPQGWVAHNKDAIFR